MTLKDRYESWTFRPIMPGAGNTPREQANGKVAVDFLPNDYQTEVRNRTPGDKTVVQASGDSDTAGSFNTTTAFRYYSTLYNSPLKNFKSRQVHLYNAQGGDDDKFITSNAYRNSPGALYTNTAQ